MLQNRFLCLRLAALDLAGNQVRLCQPIHWVLTADPHQNLHLAFFVRLTADKVQKGKAECAIAYEMPRLEPGNISAGRR